LNEASLQLQPMILDGSDDHRADRPNDRETEEYQNRKCHAARIARFFGQRGRHENRQIHALVFGAQPRPIEIGLGKRIELLGKLPFQIEPLELGQRSRQRLAIAIRVGEPCPQGGDLLLGGIELVLQHLDGRRRLIEIAACDEQIAFKLNLLR
jgi:hypothetical protein